MGELHQLGDVLVSYSARTVPAAGMALTLREIHETFKRTRDAEQAYLQMGFLAVSAIERARQLEESDDAGPGPGVRGPGARPGPRAASRPPAGSTPA